MESNTPKNSKRLIVVTIHGIRWKSETDWQNPWSVALKTLDPSLVVIPHRYQRVLALSSWMMTSGVLWKISRRMLGRYVKDLAKTIFDAKLAHPGVPVSILAHSFGTYLTYELLRQYPAIRLNTWVLVGGVVDHEIQNTELWTWFELGRIKMLRNVCSHKDRVVKYVAIKPFGKCGYWGFIRPHQPVDRGMPHPKPFPIELYNDQVQTDHSGFLDDCQGNVKRVLAWLKNQPAQ